MSSNFYRAVINKLLSAVYLATKLAGLLSGTRPSLKRNVHQSRYWRCYGFLVLGFVVGFAPIGFYNIFKHMDFLRQNILLLLVGIQLYLVVELGAICTLYIHTTRQHFLINIINSLLRCRRVLKRMLHSTHLQESFRRLYIAEHLLPLCMLLCCFAFSLCWTIDLIVVEPEATRSLFYLFCLLFALFCQLVLQLSLGIYLLAVLLVSYLVHHCNLQLACVLSDTGRVTLRRRQHGAAMRLQQAQLHWLATELWQLAALHLRLLKLSRSLCSLHGVQMLCFMSFTLVVCLVHLFITYFVHYSNWFLRRFSARLPDFWALLFISAMFVQLMQCIFYTHRMRGKFNQTREILTGGLLADNKSQALNATLQYFGLYLQQARCIFIPNACGLFKLNNALIFGILQSMVIYLTILIQFDKVMNK